MGFEEAPIGKKKRTEQSPVRQYYYYRMIRCEKSQVLQDHHRLFVRAHTSTTWAIRNAHHNDKPCEPCKPTAPR